ncbi:acyltransferase family protein [Thermaurantiacus sp.]
MLLSIQYLRFLASFLVLVAHSTLASDRDLGFTTFTTFSAGGRGVDIFFVISGFIISYVNFNTTGDRADYLMKRIIRVAPPYWLATAVMLAVAILTPHLLRSTGVDPLHVLFSFLFIPWDHPVARSTFPLLHVGWTLNYEMLFYFLFAIFLGRDLLTRTLLTSLMLVTLVLVGVIFAPRQEPFMAWTAPILMEFVYGMMIALWWKGYAQSTPARSGVVTAALLAVVIISIWMILFLPYDGDLIWVGYGDRWFTAGVPAAFLVASMLALDKRGKMPSLRFLKLLGDGSYSLYIWHFFVIGALRALWPLTGLTGDLGAVTFVASCIVVAIAVSLMGYFWIEKPVIALGRGWMERRRKAARSLAA